MADPHLGEPIVSMTLTGCSWSKDALQWVETLVPLGEHEGARDRRARLNHVLEHPA